MQGPTTAPPYSPRVGVAALVRNARGEFVFGKRKGAHGAGTLLTPFPLHPYPSPTYPPRKPPN